MNTQNYFTIKMQRFLIICLKVVLVFGIFQDVLGGKPMMTPMNDELLIQEGDELKIECFSEKVPLHFSFPEYTFYSPRSTHNISRAENGTMTFLRPKTVFLDTGWYACAAEGVEIENNWRILNHTHENIAWIYVYVNSSEPFADEYYTFPKGIIVADGSMAIIPCRPTSPDLVVRLWRNNEVIKQDEKTWFDPKIGFITQPPSSEDFQVMFGCEVEAVLGGHNLYILQYSKTTGRKPKINVYVNEILRQSENELVLQTGDELKIECHSEADVIFAYPTSKTNQYNSRHLRQYSGKSGFEISSQGKGKKTLIRRYLDFEDTGWYECREERVEDVEGYFYIGYAKENVAQIYIYVESNIVTFLPMNLPIYIRYRKTDSLLLPCRPTSPNASVELKSESQIPNDDIRFDPKYGFILRRGSSPVDACYSCLVYTKSIDYTSELFDICVKKFLGDNRGLTISPENTHLIIGEDLTLNCTAIASIFVYMQWSVPTTVSEQRVEYKTNREITNFAPIEYRSEKILMMKNVTESDSGEYKCAVRMAQLSTMKRSTIVSIFDPNGSEYIKFDETNKIHKSLRRKGQSIQWLMDFDPVSQTSIANWVTPLNKRNNSTFELTPKHRFLKVSDNRGVFIIENLNLDDSGEYEIWLNYKNDTIIINTTLEVQAPPTVSMQNEMIPSYIAPGNTFSILCNATGSPRPNITWTFAKSSEFRSYKNSSFVDDYNYDVVPGILEYTAYSYLNISPKASGVLTCTACNMLDCSRTSEKILLTGTETETETHKLPTVSVIASSVVILVVTLFALLIIQRHRRKVATRKFKEAMLERFNEGAMNCLDPKLDIVDQAEILPYDEEWEFPRELLKLGKILGSGAFGIVRKAQAQSICPREPFTTVAVKMVRATFKLHHMRALFRELKILVHLGQHVNIVNLLGSCTQNVAWGELFVIVEFCRFGNLKDYLSRRRANFIDQIDYDTEEIVDPNLSWDHANINRNSTNVDCDSSSDSGTSQCNTDSDTDDNAATDKGVPINTSPDESFLQSKYEGDYSDVILEPICTNDLLCWAWQVARGMRYLGERRVVHGDLAARNILLADNNVIKICDFGLARALYKDPTFKKPEEDALPLKWMAIESMKDRTFSVQSDIWSYGIVLWEFFTLGVTPYPEIHPKFLYQKLINGYRMDRPRYAPKNIYEIMTKCWEEDPENRPSFATIEDDIGELLEDGVKTCYVEMNAPYTEINAKMLEAGKKDYFTMTESENVCVAFSAGDEEVQLSNVTSNEPPHPVVSQSSYIIENIIPGSTSNEKTSLG